jgi:hypothetical protein
MSSFLHSKAIPIFQGTLGRLSFLGKRLKSGLALFIATAKSLCIYLKLYQLSSYIELQEFKRQELQDDKLNLLLLM